MHVITTILDRGRVALALLLVVPMALLASVPLGTDSPQAPQEWAVADASPATVPVDSAAVIAEIAASGRLTESPAAATAFDGETEATTALPAGYVSGAPPEADLAAFLARSQQRFTAAQAPAAGGGAIALTRNPRIVFTRQSQIQDLLSGQVDPRVVDVLTWIANRRQSIVITSVKTDHSTCVAGSSPCRVSAHKLGRAIDIAAVDGQACAGTPEGNCGRLYEEIVTMLRGTQYQPSQVIYGYDAWPGEPWNFAMGNHRDHIHLGY